MEEKTEKEFDIDDFWVPLKKTDVRTLEKAISSAVTNIADGDNVYKCSIDSIDYGSKTKIQLTIYEDLNKRKI